MRKIHAALILWLTVALAGCSSSPPAPAGPKTAADLLARLNLVTGEGDIDALMGLLTDEARQQTGRQWLAFLVRTQNTSVIKELQALPAADLRNLETLDAEGFLKEVYAKAPRAFSRLFAFYYQADVEENGQLLVLAKTESGQQILLAMGRQSDQTVKLAAEAQFPNAYKSLSRKLDAELRNPRP